MYSSGTIGYEKPNPRFFEAIFEDLDRAQITLMIGDSFEHDISGAKGVEIRGIWFNRGSIEQEADPAVQSISSLDETTGLLARGDRYLGQIW